jgi:hypothetical protein
MLMTSIELSIVSYFDSWKEQAITLALFRYVSDFGTSGFITQSLLTNYMFQKCWHTDLKMLVLDRGEGPH